MSKNSNYKKPSKNFSYEKPSFKKPGYQENSLDKPSFIHTEPSQIPKVEPKEK